MIIAPKGTYDVLPQDSRAWQAMEETMRRVAALGGYLEMRTPVFEHTELFQRGVGDTTDVVQKEMYTFIDKGGRSMTLKPEGTAGVVRALIEAGLTQAALPLKVYYLNAAVFRYEAPQSGRMREHHQFGVEVFGAKQPTADADIVGVALSVLGSLGVSAKLNVNSIGCPKCRPAYHEKLTEYLNERKDRLCGTCRDRLTRNPLRILDCKSPVCQAELVDAPSILDCLCEECEAHFEGFKSALAALGVPFIINSRIVRGLDYYTKTVFELITETNCGALTVCAGGRYDGLVEQLGGQSLQGVGFGMGMERLLMLLDANGKRPAAAPVIDVYVAPLSESERVNAFKAAQDLRKAGVKADCDHAARSLKAMLRYSEKLGAKWVLMLGGDEAAQGLASLRDMASHSQTTVPLEGLSDAVLKGIGVRNEA